MSACVVFGSLRFDRRARRQRPDGLDRLTEAHVVGHHLRLQFRERDLQVVRHVHGGNELTEVLETVCGSHEVRALRQPRRDLCGEVRILLELLLNRRQGRGRCRCRAGLRRRAAVFLDGFSDFFSVLATLVSADLSDFTGLRCPPSRPSLPSFSVLAVARWRRGCRFRTGCRVFAVSLRLTGRRLVVGCVCGFALTRAGSGSRLRAVGCRLWRSRLGHGRLGGCRLWRTWLRRRSVALCALRQCRPPGTARRGRRKTVCEAWRPPPGQIDRSPHTAQVAYHRKDGR